MKHTRHSKQPCPKCNTNLDCATGAYNKNATPSPGDFSICIICGTILRYGEGLKLVESSMDEATQFGLGEKMATAVNIVKRRTEKASHSQGLN
jgi:hypothetical protein